MNKGFSTILGIIIGLLVIGGGVYFYTKNDSVSVNENDSSSEKMGNEEVNNIDETKQQEENAGKGTFNSQQKMIEARTATLEYNEYLEKGVFPSEWVEKSIELQDEKVLTYIVPTEHQNIVYIEVVNKSIDSKPENEGDLKRIGGSVFNVEEYERFYGGETKKIVHYWYINATNYKWFVTELALDNSMHLELSYTFKTEEDNPNINKDLMDRIAGSVKIK